MTIINPNRDRLVVRPDPLIKNLPEVTEGGVLIPQEAIVSTQPLRGTVLESGPGCVENGSYMPNVHKPGDRVLFGTYGYDTIEVDGEKLYIIRDADVKASLVENVEDEYATVNKFHPIVDEIVRDVVEA